MKNVATVARRELAAYYTSPIGYIYMIVFLLITVGLYMTSFFLFPVADMRGYFSSVPVVLCVFIPAVTMRIWAEERKENTWELLLTFPMRAWELVLGKFLAALVFITLTFAATVTIPIMLAVLGNPDNGAIAGGYLGLLLLGAFFLAIGVFVSSLCKDQIVAFVVTLLVCFGVYLLGMDFIAAYLNDKIGGLGSALSVLVGVNEHYMSFTRGVIQVSDLLYFAVWIVLLLFLNVLFIDSRNRPGAKAAFSVAIAVCIGIGLAFNWTFADRTLGRLDMTENQIYTVSPAAKRILSGVDTTVQLKLYITPRDKMPAAYSTLERDIKDKLTDLSVASGGKVNYSVIHLEAANVLAAQQDLLNPEDPDAPKDEAKAIEERMLDKGIQPFPVQAIQEDAVTSKLIYAHIGVAYKDKPEEILAQIVPEALPELEYRLASTIYKLTQETPPVVAMVAPKEAVNIDPQLRQLYEQMGQQVPTTQDPYRLLEQVLRAEKYDVRRVELTRESPLPEEFDCLVVLNPRSLNDRQRWEINRALHAGKSVVLAVQEYLWSYEPHSRGYAVSPQPEDPQVNALLTAYGLGVSQDILMDTNHVPVNVGGGGGLAALLGASRPVDLPVQIVVKSDTMNPDLAITNRLSMVTYLWGTALDINEDRLKEAGLTLQPLMHTSDGAWTAPQGVPMTQELFEPPVQGQRYTLMALVSGQFPDAFEGKERPAWPVMPQQPGMPPQTPPSEAPAAPVTPAPGKLILAGCATTFQDDFLQGAPSNLDLFMNSIDASTLTEDLVHIRGQKPVNRVIQKPAAPVRRVWQFLNYGLMSSIIAVAGITVLVVRRQQRNAYTMAQAAARR